jgi:hypothetical protein
MVKDQQVRRLLMLINEEKTLVVAASSAGMDEKTARRYRKLARLPSEVSKPHTWRTRIDVFEAVWPELEALLEASPGLESLTLFEHLQRCNPGKFSDGQLRTLQRRVKVWRATKGPAKEARGASFATDPSVSVTLSGMTNIFID